MTLDTLENISNKIYEHIQAHNVISEKEIKRLENKVNIDTQESQDVGFRF